MGRPRLAANKRRSLRIAVRLSVSDLEKLEARKPEAESLGAYIRNEALRRCQPAPVPEVNRIALWLLNEHGQRVNEATRAAHQGEPVTLTARELSELTALLKRLLYDLRR